MNYKIEKLFESRATCLVWAITAILSLVTMCVLFACYANTQLQDIIPIAGYKITSCALGLSVVGFAFMGASLPCALCLNGSACNDVPLPLVICILGSLIGVLLIEYTGFLLPFVCHGAMSGLMVYETMAVFNPSTGNVTQSRQEISSSSKSTLVAGSVLALLTTLLIIVLNCLWYCITRRTRIVEQRSLLRRKRNNIKISNGNFAAF